MLPPCTTPPEVLIFSSVGIGGGTTRSGLDVLNFASGKPFGFKAGRRRVDDNGFIC